MNGAQRRWPSVSWRADPVPIFQHLERIATLLVSQGGQAQVIQEQHIHPGQVQRLEESGDAPVPRANMSLAIGFFP